MQSRFVSFQLRPLFRREKSFLQFGSASFDVGRRGQSCATNDVIPLYGLFFHLLPVPIPIFADADGGGGGPGPVQAGEAD